MSRLSKIHYRFVHYIPEAIDEGVLYISIEFATTVHRCYCGCGEEVVAVLSPTDWSLHYNGESVSLNPSIGNWSLKCQSHYWIRWNRVLWARPWTREEINLGRTVDQRRKQRQFSGETADAARADRNFDDPLDPEESPSRRSY